MGKRPLPDDNVVSKAQFKARALEYFRRVQETGRPLLITDNGTPVIKIVPYTPSLDELLLEFRGSVQAYDGPTEPVSLEDWE